MKVLLLNTPSRKRPVIRDMAGGIGFDGGDAIRLPPLDLLYFGATLLDKGHTVRVIDADAENMTDEQAITKACEFSPDIIIATVSLPTIYNDTAFLKKLKTTLNPAKVIAKTGIKYPQILKEMLELSCADLVIYGECDTIVDKIIENQC
jgi:DNA-binding NarL/FixJ family response regulator